MRLRLARGGNLRNETVVWREEFVVYGHALDAGSAERRDFGLSHVFIQGCKGQDAGDGYNESGGGSDVGSVPDWGQANQLPPSAIQPLFAGADDPAANREPQQPKLENRHGAVKEGKQRSQVKNSEKSRRVRQIRCRTVYFSSEYFMESAIPAT